MKRIIKTIRKAEEWLCSVPADKLLHFLAGVITSWLIFILCHGVATPVITGVIATAGSLVVGTAKEAIDRLTGGDVSKADALCTLLGGVLGSALCVTLKLVACA